MTSNASHSFFLRRPGHTRRTLLATFCLLAGLGCAPFAQAQETQTQYLSGHGKDDAVPWGFLCSATSGMKVNLQTTIPVPSNWTLQGFGTYSYGNQNRPSAQGLYTRTFSVPAAWAGRRVVLVFEGVMTDTSVMVNGQSAGPTHQGGFYRFQYDITSLVKTGPAQTNQLAVTVDAESANASVNNAERKGDYWNFEGIYRPVYLEAFPAQSIDRVAVNAKADGSFAVDAYLAGVTTADTIEGQIQDTAGRPVGKPFTARIGGASTAHLQTLIASPRLWTAETPNLYQVTLRLKRGASVVHQMHQRFGFRTIELRPTAGLFVNGKKVLLKGTNRHSFWPDSGRCLSDAISRQDIGLMKGLNMNAVRMSHYPPDQHFLDDCDELGLYVLDELGGWQHGPGYDTPTGTRLVKEMVTRDVNHPSILVWDNGNEGGWNTAVEPQYPAWDPQNRPVNHPQTGGLSNPTPYNNILDAHYQSYTLTQSCIANGSYVYMTTEFLHGLFDGGMGAGLADYWDVIRQGKSSAGGFLWSFVDEGVKRVDQGGRIDVVGNAAPDGVLGPYREMEGSALTVKQVWSPVVITDSALPPGASPALHVENRYDFTNLSRCRFTWELRRFNTAADTQSGFTVLSKGAAAPSAPVPPGASGTLPLRLTPNWRQTADALAVRALDPSGRELWTWVWPLSHANTFRAAITTPGSAAVTATDTADAVQVVSGDLTLGISRTTGQLASVQRAGRPFSLTNGPRLVAGTPAGADTLTAIEHHADGGDQVITATYGGALKTVTWRVHPSGWVQVNYAYSLSGPQDYFGVGFDYPEANVQSMRWLGDGPYRTYKNRRAGGTLNVWGNTYNKTITGDALWQYPEFKGYYGDVRWAQFQTTEGPITAVLGGDDQFLQVFTPDQVAPNQRGRTGVAYPSAGFSILNAIPAIGSKFSTAESTGPAGQQPVAAGDYQGSVSFYFGAVPR